jgi:hypothetical protein
MDSVTLLTPDLVYVLEHHVNKAMSRKLREKARLAPDSALHVQREETSTPNTTNYLRPAPYSLAL